LADDAMPALMRLAIHRAHGRLLNGAADANRILAALGEAAARAGLTNTAAMLLDMTKPGLEAIAGRTALAVVLTERGELDGVMQQLTLIALGGDALDLDRKLRARAALAAGDLARASAALRGVESASGRELEPGILAQVGAWAELARLSGAELAALGPDAGLEPLQAAAAVWLGLAETQLGRTDEAADLAARYAAHIKDPELASLLTLATIAVPAAHRDGTLTGHFAAARRRDLAMMAPPTLGNAGGRIRTASARSGPAG
jgi:hypothetical protein